MIKRILLGALTAFCVFTSSAQGSDIAEVKKAIEATLGNSAKVDSVRDAGVLGLYEVVVGGEILYTDRKATYLFLGDIMEARS
ncbi:MAG TPA: disulfide isomerase DsbC N-terminal domain-containing protein, partial [Nevskia sp.]|nr:disulfide isomerase DsbC N-terminal domain-containing protein [Nevskia sp.]